MTFTSTTIGEGGRSQLPPWPWWRGAALVYVSSFLLRREGLKANPASLSDKAGNLAGAGLLPF
jgi:hypothetical protein